MLGIAGFASDAISERQPGFGDEKEPRFVGRRDGAFDQIEAGRSQLAVLEFQTHWRTPSNFIEGHYSKPRLEFGNAKRLGRFHRGE